MLILLWLILLHGESFSMKHFGLWTSYDNRLNVGGSSSIIIVGFVVLFSFIGSGSFSFIAIDGSRSMNMITKVKELQKLQKKHNRYSFLTSVISSPLLSYSSPSWSTFSFLDARNVVWLMFIRILRLSSYLIQAMEFSNIPSTNCWLFRKSFDSIVSTVYYNFLSGSLWDRDKI